MFRLRKYFIFVLNFLSYFYFKKYNLGDEYKDIFFIEQKIIFPIKSHIKINTFHPKRHFSIGKMKKDFKKLGVFVIQMT